MDLTFIQNYLVFVIVGICLCTGYIIKESMPKIVHKYIPLLMGILGVLLNVWINQLFNAEILLGGLFSGLASTGLHQAFKQLIGQNKGRL